MVLCAALGNVIMGYCMAVYNPLQENLNMELNIDKSYEKYITAIVPFGAMIGAFLCNWL